MPKKPKPMTKAESEAARIAENKAKLKAEQEAKDKAAAEVEAKAKKVADDEMKRPLSAEEKVELKTLEAQANQGRFQPDPPQMLKLGRLRQRAKLA